MMPVSVKTDSRSAASPPPAVQAPRLLKLAAVATLLGVAPITVRRRVRDGSLAHVRIHDRLYFSEADVRAFIARNHHGASSERF